MKYGIDVLALKGQDGKTYLRTYGLLYIHRLLEFMDLVLNSSDTCYKTVPCGQGARQLPTLIGRNHIPRLSDYITTFCRTYKFHPAIAFFFSQYMRHRIRHLEIYTLKDQCGNGETAAEVADDFLAVMRKEAVRIRLRKEIHNWDSKVKTNRKGIVKLLDTMFALCSKPMVVRDDFNYRASMFTPQEKEQAVKRVEMERQADLLALEALPVLDQENGTYGDFDGLPEPRVFTGRASLEQVKKDRKRFFKKLKKHPVYKHLLGYAWRIDCAIEAGFHIHVVFFFDGHNVEQDAYYGELLGQLWEEVVGDRGYYHNVNRDKEKYEPNDKWALGMVRYDDHKKRDILLNNVLDYFTKDEKSARFVLEDESQMFRTVCVKKLKPETRGRPRKKAA